MDTSNFSVISFLFFFLIIFSCVSCLQFNLSTFGPDSINLARDAYFSDQGIQLTPELVEKIGRATYIEPLHLWDKSSGMLTNFSTSFSFVIYSDNSSGCVADGLAFFLTPVGSRIPPAIYGAGYTLGLTNNSLSANASLLDPIVAVEFDTFPNLVYDPQGQIHVGIDINSLQSAATKTWRNNITRETVNHAWITYDSIAKNLTAVFTGFLNNTNFTDSLSYMVDLSRYLPEWVSIGFSGATGRCFEKNNIKSWTFYSSLPDAQPPVVPPPTGRRRKWKTGTVIGIAAGLTSLLFLLALLGYGVWKQRNKKNEATGIQLLTTMDNEFEKGSGAKRFSYGELTTATSKFSDEGKLGVGGFGSVYRGFLKETNSFVAVKKVSSDSKQGLKEYASEVKIISQLRHRNLVQLIGWCHEKGDLLLVYEFMPNGSLDSHLFKERSLLCWEARYKIAQGLASALLYLHEEWEHCVVHRDIKSSNVMLDSGFNAKLGDFGLARVVDHEKGSQTTMVAGTMGYMAPECVITGKASKDSDVYSFGIVALEIACGRKPIVPSAPENEIILVQWIWELYGSGKLLEGADPKLGSEFVKEEMLKLMIVGLWCANPDTGSRPSIRQVINVLNSGANLPNLPPKMPVPTYTTPGFSPHNSSNFHTYNDDTDDDSVALQSSGSSGFITSSKHALSPAISHPPA